LLKSFQSSRSSHCKPDSDDSVEIKAFISGVQEMANFACVSLSHACLALGKRDAFFYFFTMKANQTFAELEIQWLGKV
jgi:hypothetical protein